MEMNTSQAKSVVVTGGSRGIGLAIARAFAAEGSNVAITGRDETALAAAEQELRASAAQVFASRTDVRDFAAVEACMREAASRFGGIDVLVNNLNGVFYCCKAALPFLRKSTNAYVVNISSLAGKNWFAGGAAYCASKAGLNALSESMMQDLRQHDIRVSYVMPGSVNTEFNFMGAKPADWKLTGEDIAKVVLDLVSSDRRALASRVEIRPSKPR
jgi:3-oxoacyl-[acyl-carrier protein] reductase